MLVFSLGCLCVLGSPLEVLAQFDVLLDGHYANTHLAIFPMLHYQNTNTVEQGVLHQRVELFVFFHQNLAELMALDRRDEKSVTKRSLVCSL